MFSPRADAYPAGRKVREREGAFASTRSEPEWPLRALPRTESQKAARKAIAGLRSQSKQQRP